MYKNPSSTLRPFRVKIRRSGKQILLGSFVTAEEAALVLARSPEGQALAAEEVAVMTSEEARQQAQAEGLTLRVANNRAGYRGVHLDHPGHRKPYQARA